MPFFTLGHSLLGFPILCLECLTEIFYLDIYYCLPLFECMESSKMAQ